MFEPTPTKTCKRCGAQRPLGEFGKRADTADGLTRWCKPCSRARDRERRRENPERFRERDRRWAAENREKRLATQKSWRDRNPEHQAALARAWKAANPHRQQAIMDRFRANNPDYWREYDRRWRQENPEKARAKDLRRRLRELDALTGPVDLDALWTGLCGICRGTLDRTLAHPDPLSKSVDHIVPLSKGGAHEQSNLQWAHLVCNIRKGAKAP